MVTLNLISINILGLIIIKMQTLSVICYRGIHIFLQSNTAMPDVNTSFYAHAIFFSCTNIYNNVNKAINIYTACFFFIYCKTIHFLWAFYLVKFANVGTHAKLNTSKNKWHFSRPIFAFFKHLNIFILSKLWSFQVLLWFGI